MLRTLDTLPAVKLDVAKPCRVLVMTSSTGGGHDMRARSLKAWAALAAQEAVPGQRPLEVEIFQVLESISGLYRLGVEAYNVIQRQAPWAHHGYFNLLEALQLHARAGRIARVARERFRERVAAWAPEVVISTHAHLNHGFFELAREAVPGVRCLTYCGEVFGGYGFARGWVNPAGDSFLAATEACHAEALRLGMPPDRCHRAGFLLHPCFWEARPRLATREGVAAFLRETTGLPGAAPYLILATGANSAHNHLPLLRALARAETRVEVVALCGNDDLARAAIRAWGCANPRLPVVALPRQDSPAIRDLMAGAAAILARPGTGTTCEAILCGCPVIHNGIGGIMPQEWLTVKFLRSAGLDRVITRPAALPRALAPLLDAAKRADISAALQALRPPGHPREILQLVGNPPSR